MEKIKNKMECSLDEEMLMWTSYRYCIGRKSYVTTLASYIAQKYYPILNNDRLEYAARDIRGCILDNLHWTPFEFSYEGTVCYEDRKPLEDWFTFVTENNIDTIEKMLVIDKVSVYHETYQKGEIHKYHITYKTSEVQKYVSQTDIDTLIPWMNLASLFNKKNHKLLHVKYDNKEEDILAFESWVTDIKECEDSPGYYRIWPWHWKKVYISVDEFVNKGEYSGYIAPQFIEKIQD